jgi:hypothetical protein
LGKKYNPYYYIKFYLYLFILYQNLKILDCDPKCFTCDLSQTDSCVVCSDLAYRKDNPPFCDTC